MPRAFVSRHIAALKLRIQTSEITYINREHDIEGVKMAKHALGFLSPHIES